jgi:hypothetical protein
MSQLSEMSAKEIISWEGHVTAKEDRKLVYREMLARALRSRSIEESYELYH